MRPETIQVLSLLLVVMAIIVGAIAISAGHWITVAAMVLIVLGQGLTFRKARISRENRS